MHVTFVSRLFSGVVSAVLKSISLLIMVGTYYLYLVLLYSVQHVILFANIT